MTWHIHLSGRVQGVGFRPFVYQLARKFELKGWVNNTTDGVHIEFNADSPTAHDFYETVLRQAPELARITSHQLEEAAEKFFDNFQIIQSEQNQQADLLLTPDFSLCEDCRREVHKATDRRYRYPFITCTNCGPRYSIIRQLPYDRERTAMDHFPLCPTCAKEYHDPLDRRYFSQTNSCPECGIQLQLLDDKGQFQERNYPVILQQIIAAWAAGKIVAIKGIGGFLLTCDPSQAPTIQLLRDRKHRPSKPLALMFPDLATIQQLTSGMNETIAGVLTSPEAPIVLLPANPQAKDQLALEQIAPGLDHIGVMLPYAPIFEILLREWGKPIVATSGNHSQSPIIYRNDQGMTDLQTIADLIISNNREILIPQDDSVLRYSTFYDQKITLRRSRGLAPGYISSYLSLPQSCVLATGAEMKSSFCLAHRGNCYISQYLGDLKQFDTQLNYRQTVQHFLDLFQAQPEKIVCDLHPAYASTFFAESLAKELQIPLQRVQHHEAHCYAVLAENNLLASRSSVLCVIWDGMGWGSDDQIWGGEFFLYEAAQLHRKSHWAYYDLILGDKMAKEPRIAALSLSKQIPDQLHRLEKKFSEQEWQLYRKLLAGGSAQLQTSSTGRLFDAVASILGLKDIQSYSGEAALLLEHCATRYFKKHGLDDLSPYPLPVDTIPQIDTRMLLKAIYEELAQGQPVECIAARFHLTLVHLIRSVADNLKVNKIAFSGGVFQNALLVDLLHHHLGDPYSLFFHQQLSPNDENIAFGQLVSSITHS